MRQEEKVASLKSQAQFNTFQEEAMLAEYLKTPAGRKQLRSAIQLGAAKAADKFPEGSMKWYIARARANLPFKLVR